MVTKRFSQKEFKEIYSKVPRICVELLIKNEKKEFLLTYRLAHPKDIWHLPGGTLLFDETIEEATKRIANEELGVEVKFLGIAGHIDYIREYDKEYGRPVSIVVNTKLMSSPEQIHLDEQASKFGFFKIIPGSTQKKQREFLESLTK